MRRKGRHDGRHSSVSRGRDRGGGEEALPPAPRRRTEAQGGVPGAGARRGSGQPEVPAAAAAPAPAAPPSTMGGSVSVGGAPPTRTAVDQRLSLFIDFENIALGVRDAQYKKFDIHLVLQRLIEKGRIVFKKAYADWTRY